VVVAISDYDNENISKKACATFSATKPGPLQKSHVVPTCPRIVGQSSAAFPPFSSSIWHSLPFDPDVCKAVSSFRAQRGSAVLNRIK